MSPEPFLAGEATTAEEEAPSSSSPQENVSATPPPSAGALKGSAPAIRCVGLCACSCSLIVMICIYDNSEAAPVGQQAVLNAATSICLQVAC